MVKNKYIAGILVMLLFLTSCGVSSAEGGETEPPPPHASAASSVAASEPAADKAGNDAGIPAYYAAYQEIAADYQERYGIGTVQQVVDRYDKLTSLMGVCIVRLLDLDKNGTEELLMIWAESDQQDRSYSYGIWTSLDGRTAEKICENRILDGVQAYGPYIELVERADGIYLGEDCMAPDGGECHVYRKATAGGISDALTLVHIPPYGQDEQTLVNGEPVNYEAYTQARENFLGGAEATRIDLTSWSLLTYFTEENQEERYFEAFIRDTQDVMANLAGKEKADSYRYEWRPKDSYSSFGEVISAYLAGFGEPCILPSSRYDGGDEMPALGGLCVARLLDMDQDGTEELVMVYPWKEPIGEGERLAYQYSIWAMQDGIAAELYANTLPATAYEPTMALFVGSERSYLNFSYDTNTEQAASLANVEFTSECHTFDGQSLIKLGYEDIPQEAVNNDKAEWIYFSANSYRWAGMDWGEDSQRVLTRTWDTISLLSNSSN